MVCSKCGAENPVDARFCGKCGTALTGGPPIIPKAASAEKPAAQSLPPKKGGMTPLIIFGGVAVIILGIAGLAALMQFSRSSQPVPEPINDDFYPSTPVQSPGLPPSPSKFGDYNNTMNSAANVARSAESTENSDAVYARKIVGIWKVRKIILGALVDLNCTYLANGRASWSGSYTYLGVQYPLSYSGTWEVNEGICHTRVEASNVPQIISVGQTGAGQIINITDKTWTYRDLADGTAGTAERIR